MGYYHVNRIGKGMCLGDQYNVSFKEDVLVKYFPDKETVLTVNSDLKPEIFDSYEEWPFIKKLAYLDPECRWSIRHGDFDRLEEWQQDIIANTFHFCFEKRYGYPPGSFVSVRDYDGNIMIFCDINWPPKNYYESLATLTEDKFKKQLQEFLVDLTGDTKFATRQIEICEEYIKE